MADIDDILAEEGVADAPTWVVGAQPNPTWLTPRESDKAYAKLVSAGESTRFQPGHNGSDRPERYPITSAIRKALTPEQASRLVDVAIDDAINGPPRTRAVAREFLADRIEGKPRVRMEIEAVPFEASGYGQAMAGLREELQSAGLLPALVVQPQEAPTD